MTVTLNEMVPLKSIVVKDIILPETYVGDLEKVEDYDGYLETLLKQSIEFITKNSTEILTQCCVTKHMLENTKLSPLKAIEPEIK